MRRNSPSVTTSRPQSRCSRTTSRMASSCAARRASPCSVLKASRSFFGRSRLPMWSARQGRVISLSYRNDMDIQPVSQVMGAEVRGVDLSAPLDATAFGEILHAFHRHMLLVFPNQHIDEAQQVAFSRRFGELQVHVLEQYRHPQHPEIFVQSNVDRKTGKTTGTHPDKGSLVWHSDLSFLPRPALATALYGIEVPDEGGDT